MMRCLLITNYHSPNYHLPLLHPIPIAHDWLGRAIRTNTIDIYFTGANHKIDMDHAVITASGREFLP